VTDRPVTDRPVTDRPVTDRPVTDRPVTERSSSVTRTARALLASLTATTLVLAPTAAGAAGDNIVTATNEVDGAAVVEASVQYRVVANGVVDQENAAYALASCVDCQTLAAALQLVVVTRDWHTLVPHNEAFAANVLCEECLTWASAKQVIVATDGPAALTGAGHIRMRALENRLEALEASLPTLSLGDLAAELDAAFAELLAIAQDEVRRIDAAPQAARVVAIRSS
jgi:hypothetical protein